MVSAWPEQPSAKPAEPSARVDGQEAFVLCASETLLNWHLNRTLVPLLWRRSASRRSTRREHDHGHPADSRAELSRIYEFHQFKTLLVDRGIAGRPYC